MRHSLLFAVAALSLCTPIASAQAPAPGSVTGTVTYRHRMALPPDAVVDVRLRDTTQPDAEPRTLGQATIATRGAQVPIPFRLDYDPAAIDPAHRYTVHATITVDGRMLFTSPAEVPVLTRGAGNQAAIEVFMLLPAGNPKNPG